MTRTEHLLIKLAEECAETAQRATKAMRFGLKEVQPNQPHDNAHRLMDEILDVVTVWEMLHDDGLVPDLIAVPLSDLNARRAKIEKYLDYSRQCGTLTGKPPLLHHAAGTFPLEGDHTQHAE